MRIFKTDTRTPSLRSPGVCHNAKAMRERKQEGMLEGFGDPARWIDRLAGAKLEFDTISRSVAEP